MNLRTDNANVLEAGLLSAAVDQYASGTEQERGAVFTRRSVVDLILDLVGYVESAPLHQLRLLEPAAGAGDFLVPAVGRLVRSYLAHGGTSRQAAQTLSEAIRAFEVHPASFDAAFTAVTAELTAAGIPRAGAAALARSWLVIGDYLLSVHVKPFTHVVGNPPYVRQELIPDALLARYRKRFRTLYDRADLYVLFYEHSLNALAPSGRLGFICADRWTKNKYGGPLRKMVSAEFALTHYVDLVGTPAFHSDVIAYPAITVLQRQAVSRMPMPATRMAYRPTVSESALAALSGTLTASRIRKKSGVIEIPEVVHGAEPWLLDQPERLALVRRLEASFPALEDAGCRVGIGVATGADDIYLRPFDELNIEPSRKLPVVRTQDIRSGRVEWKGLAVINPFRDGGGVVDLKDFPKLARYLEQHADTIRKRSVSQRNPTSWFRTIDRIYPALAATPKLLIPDIKGYAHVVYEDGQLYPHHNLYYITTDDWDLRALQAVLMSGVARLFVATYSPVMSGGFLRFQAQYLRRIRVPLWKNVSAAIRRKLTAAAQKDNAAAASAATFALYGLTPAEQTIVERDSGSR